MAAIITSFFAILESWGGLLLGLGISGLSAVFVISVVSFPFAVGKGTVVDLYDLGRGLRLRGVRVTETGDGITVPAGPLYSIEMRSVKGKAGT